MGKTPRIQVSIVESAVVVGIVTALTTLLIPAVEAARYANNSPPAFPSLIPFYRDHPILFVVLSTLVSVALTVGLLAATRRLSSGLRRRIIWGKPKGEPEFSPEVQARIAVVANVLVFGSILLCCSGIVFYSRPEEVAELHLSGSYRARIFAEGSFHYEPPGYLSIEVFDNGNVVVPRYKFVGIGPERVPTCPFAVLTSKDGSVAALVQNNDVQFMVDLVTGECWPPPNWNVAEFAPGLADRLFAGFAARPDVTFSRLEHLKRVRASRAKSLDGGRMSGGKKVDR